MQHSWNAQYRLVTGRPVSPFAVKRLPFTCPRARAVQPASYLRTGGSRKPLQRFEYRSISGGLELQPPAAPPHVPQAVSAATAASVAAAPSSLRADEAAQDDIEAEALRMLEWDALCRQVSCFTATTMGAEVAGSAALVIGRSPAESEQLLQQTAEASLLDLSFHSVYDLRPLVVAVAVGRRLHPLQLCGVATTLAAAANLERSIAAASASGALLQLTQPIDGALPDLVDDICHCIQAEGRILDRASQELGRVRAARRENLGRLQATMAHWARSMHRAGVCERPQVVTRRDRLCIPVRAGRQGELPKGSVTLASSASGSTFYMEPAPALHLNNTEAELAAAEEQEEHRILLRLSRQVAGCGERVLAVVEAVAQLDLVAARARHAAWLGAARPCFRSAQEAAAAGAISLRGLRHPLLLEASLPALPMPPMAEDADFESNYMPPVVVQPLDVSSNRQTIANSTGDSIKAPARPPVPIDVTVPAGVHLVALTGPNTGGKTASLKALGLAALMAKAGMFLPVLHEAQQQGQPQLLWFDKVLADVGDGQSLQQSLSTFSGHVRRVSLILAAMTPSSLILLDEVGSGTDPVEGSALAAALLERFADEAALTYATTHHAALKEMAAANPRYINASVEFDVATLRPTYRLLWRQAGASNALAIAEGLGFDARVVAEARKILAAGNVSGVGQPQDFKSLMANFQDQLAEAQAQAEAAAASKRQAEQEVAALVEQERQLAAEVAALAAGPSEPASHVVSLEEELRRAMEDAQAGRVSLEEAEAVVRRAEAAAAGARADAQGAPSTSSQGGDQAWQPQKGQRVAVASMSGAAGRVTKVDGDRLTVRMGRLTLQLTRSQVKPAHSVKEDGAAGLQSLSLLGAGGGRSAKAKMRSPQDQVRWRPSSGGGGGGASQFSCSPAAVLTIQTSHNTVDVRGESANEAALAVEGAMAGLPPGAALYVVHGVGARARLRTELWAFLRRHPQVASFKEEEGSAGGCTVVSLI